MPRLSLIKPSVCPPDGFRYVFPEDGYVAHAWTYVDWINLGLAHQAANPDIFKNPQERLELENQMQDQLCKILPPGWCNFDSPSAGRVSFSMTWDDVKNGVTTFFAWISKGMQYVPQAEADRRAAICARCYFNLPVSGCSGCQKVVAKIVGVKKTKHDSLLKACGVCRCLLRAKVHFPLPTLLDTANERRQALYPEFCWLKKGGENYHG